MEFSANSKTARPVYTIVFHGDEDRIVHPSNAAGFLSAVQQSSSQPLKSRSENGRSKGGRDFTRTEYWRGSGDVLLENWTVHGSGHAWSGGSAAGSYTDPAGPDASHEMIRFFLARKRAATGLAIKRKPRSNSH
jgi:poly(3-hydroxybutyrate) depolymerase